MKIKLFWGFLEILHKIQSKFLAYKISQLVNFYSTQPKRSILSKIYTCASKCSQVSELFHPFAVRTSSQILAKDRREFPRLDPGNFRIAVACSTDCLCRLWITIFVWKIKRMKYDSVSQLFINEELIEVSVHLLSIVFVVWWLLQQSVFFSLFLFTGYPLAQVAKHSFASVIFSCSLKLCWSWSIVGLML